jgi:hypothetical protein
MKIYYPSVHAIQQQTLQLDHEQCSHCKQSQQLVSHGFIHRKRVGALPAAIGKRVFCSNRRRRTGCGRTVQLYLDSTLRYLHYAAGVVEAFLLALLAGMTIQRAYLEATGTEVPRNAYRWLSKVWAQLSAYRSLLHQPQLPDMPQTATANRPLRRCLLMATAEMLLRQWGPPLCAGFQRKWQRSFL